MKHTTLVLALLSLVLGRVVAARRGQELADVLRQVAPTIFRDRLYGVQQ